MVNCSRKMNGETANKFISALVKALQTLCHGYVEFNDGIEIIGHIYLNIDSGASFDYVVKEKLCKNAENSTVFVSKSFQAQAPADECVSRKDRDEDEGPHFEDTSNMSPTAGTSRLQSAITSISNVLSGSQDSQKPRHLEHTPHHPSLQNTGKRKRDHSSSFNSMQPPFKYTTLQTSSLPSSSYFGSGPSSKPAADRNHSEHFSSASHAEFFGGDSNQSSGMGADDEDDLRLDVTFVKEEYESQRNSSQRGVSANAASRLSQDLSSSHSNMLHDGTAGSGSLAYSSSHHQGPQHFSSDAAGDMRSINEDFQESSQVDVGQHAGHEPPNPRNDASAGPPPRMPEGVKPLCGYVHPDDAKKWMMYDLLPGSGVFIHQENYNVVLSKTRQDRPDGKAMARYLMSCFWRQSELVGASIAEPPKPHQRSLDRGIVHAILGFCQHHSRELPTDIRRTMQQKIGYAKFYFVKKTLDPDSPKTTPASISVEASPRRMSMEMARRGVGGLPLDLPVKLHAIERRGRRASETLSRGLSEPGDLASRLTQRTTPELSARCYSEVGGDIANRLPDESARLVASSSTDILSERLPPDISSRLTVGMLARRMSADLGSRISNEYSGRVSSDLSVRVSDDPTARQPDDLSTRSANDLSSRSSELSTNRLPAERFAETPLDIMSVRTSETSLSELANRIGAVPAGMSRGFLDMLNNIYPNN